MVSLPRCGSLCHLRWQQPTGLTLPCAPAGVWGRAPKPYAAACFASVASARRAQETRLSPKSGVFQRSEADKHRLSASDCQKALWGGSEGRRPATSIVAAGAGRAHRSFRLTPSGRFALRASAHRAHASLRPLRMKSESSDMCGGFGSLAQQGFLARFPGRAAGAGETCPGGKDRRRRAFSTRWGGQASLVRLCYHGFNG